MSKAIDIFNLGNLPTADLDDFHELQEDFKISDPQKTNKLALLIVTRGFKYAFKAWKDPDGKLWIIDAHQRKKALAMLRGRGLEIPPIPYEPIYAADKREAVEEIAAYNSEFAKKNPDTLLFDKYHISSDSLAQFSINYGIDVEKSQFTIDTKQAIAEDMQTINPADDDMFDENTPILPLSQARDIWLLGRHRLMCGDSLDMVDVTALMNGRRADLIITDPPYNVNYEGGTDDQLTIANDNMSDEEFDKFLYRAHCNMFKVSREGTPIYVFHSDTEGLAFRRNFKRAGFKLAQCCIWVKNSIVMGRQDYQWKHEPVLYGWREDAAHGWYADRSQSTVWNFDRPTHNDLHPTMKPVALIAYPMLNSSKEGGLVVDFFSGSGSTLMAAEQHNRVCYAMELDSKYVDATIHRFVKAVGAGNIEVLRGGKTIKYQELTNDN